MTGLEFSGFSLEILLFLFVIAISAGFLDTLAGGGGLLSLPALLISGVPPLFALGTNKLQGSMGTATATLMMFRLRKVKFAEVKRLMLAAFIGSAVGSLLIQFIDTTSLDLVVPFILFFIAIYFLFSPRVDENDVRVKMSAQSYNAFVVPIIGCYDGMFGPGTGSFFAMSGVALRGYRLIQSTSIAKTLNFATNFSSLVVFLMAGKIVWTAGLLMMGGQMIGAWLGAHILFHINPRLLRFIVVAMCLGMLVRYSQVMGWFTF